ncbi:MAG: DUF445 domain-containing protein [Acidimicrobiia bacterium]|nr:DUF445 domain-containing protein [Acidimicrobiia bacterium]MDH4362553.1 DUF445 domain-containing protein [Acidimicrobiia bacterium]MDH5290949.1 DUF445 domain-containing protein [Acidimicrobiia bacterium]
MSTAPDLFNPGDEERRRDLRRMKALATGLLALAAAVFLASRALEPDHRWLGYVRATAEAAMVGALADWFAVTALFRRPLGLPIPHTAIIQTRKDQIGVSLGGFVRDNFLTAPVIAERLQHAGLAHRVGRWLAQPGNAATVSAQSAAVVRGVTEVLEDDLVQGGIEHVALNRIRSVPVSPLVGRVIDAAVEGDHHQALLDGVLGGLATFLDENRPAFRERLNQESPWWVPDALDDVVFDKIYSAVKSFLADLQADPGHQLRADFDRRVRRFAEELKTSPELRRRGEQLRDEVLDHPEVRAWSATLWTRIKTSMLEATEDPDSALRVRLDEALVSAGRSLQDDPALQTRIDRWIVEATGYVAEQFRGEVADLIATTVQRWDTAETAQRLELQVGRDLQFIRINGTVVGGVAGLAIHTVSQLLF